MNPLCILDAVVHHARFRINTFVFKRRSFTASRNAPAPLSDFHTTLPDDTEDPVVFTGADRNYLKLYGSSFVESIARVSDRLRVHLHVMLLEGENCQEQLRELLELIPSGRMTFSIEVCAAPSSNWNLRAQFFQVRRFLRLSQMVSLRNFDVLALDVDTVILKSPEFLSDEWLEHDLLLQANLGPLRPTPFTCACSWLRPSARVRKILDRAAKQMQRHDSTGLYVDHIDERCFANEVYEQPGMKIVALPDNFCSSNADDSFIFDGAGDEKTRIRSVFSSHISKPLTGREVDVFRKQCMVGELRRIHFGKAWNRASLSILWRRMIE